MKGREISKMTERRRREAVNLLSSTMAEFVSSRPYLAQYQGTDLFGFNGARTKLLGYIELVVTYEEIPLAQTVKTIFLVFLCHSIYNCIIGKTTLGQLGESLPQST